MIFKGNWINVVSNWCLISRFCQWSSGLGKCLLQLPFLLKISSTLLSLFLSSWKIEVGHIPNYLIVLECLYYAVSVKIMGWNAVCFSAWIVSWGLDWTHLPIIFILRVYFIMLNIPFWTFTLGCSVLWFLEGFSDISCCWTNRRYPVSIPDWTAIDTEPLLQIDVKIEGSRVGRDVEGRNRWTRFDSLCTWHITWT